jgi:CRISPR type IV-associated protein Csf2
MTINVLIRGVVTTTALTHQSAPADRGQSKGQCMKTGVIGQGGSVLVPYITANSVRGLIRRAAGDVVLERLVKAKAHIPRNLYLSIVRGAYARTGVNAGGATYTQMLDAAHHTFAGLFGGGAFMYRSPLRFERDLLPILETTRGLFPLDVQPFAVDREPWQLIQKTMMAPRDDFARLPAMAREVVEDVEAAYTEHMLTKVQQNEVKAADETATKDDLDNFMGEIEHIIPGVPLFFGISATGVTESQAGLLIYALHRWANRNALGGASARGRGSFTPSLSLYIDGVQVTSNLLVGDAPLLSIADSPRIAELLKACDKALDVDATAASLESVYPTVVKEEKDKAKKKGKGTKAEEPSAAE